MQRRLKISLSSKSEEVSSLQNRDDLKMYQSLLEKSEKEKALLQAKHRALKSQAAEAAVRATERENNSAATLDGFVENQASSLVLFLCLRSTVYCYFSILTQKYNV